MIYVKKEKILRKSLFLIPTFVLFTHATHDKAIFHENIAPEDGWRCYRRLAMLLQRYASVATTVCDIAAKVQRLCL
jgi:hypothetical protein